MARYIDADKLVDWCKETLQVQSTSAGKAYVDAFLTAVLSCSAADVAPRAEVAREILDELEEVLCGEYFTERFWFDLGKLRIKYIEGQK